MYVLQFLSPGNVRYKKKASRTKECSKNVPPSLPWKRAISTLWSSQTKPTPTMSVWDFDTIDATVQVFRAKWMPLRPIEAWNDPNTRVENFVNELFMIPEEPSEHTTDITVNTFLTNDQLKAGEALISECLNAGVPAEDILLALYVGSDVVDIKRCTTLNFVHKLAKRFLDTHPVQIPAAFLHTVPEPWRPVARDDWDDCEWRCHEIGMEYLMARASGLEFKLPWCPTVVPASDYRAPINDMEEDDDEESQVLMTSDSCVTLLQHYTMVILNSVYV